jgi:hypothetical protein
MLLELRLVLKFDIVAHILHVGITPGPHYHTLVPNEAREAFRIRTFPDFFEYSTGSQALKILLNNLDLDKVIQATRLSLLNHNKKELRKKNATKNENRETF